MNTELRQPAPMTSEWGSRLAQNIALFNLQCSLSENLQIQLALLDTNRNKLAAKENPPTHEEIIDAIIQTINDILRAFPDLTLAFETSSARSSITLTRAASDPEVTSDSKKASGSENAVGTVPLSKDEYIAKLQGFFTLLNALFCSLAHAPSNTFELPTKDVERTITSLTRLEPEHVTGTLCILPEISLVTVSYGQSPQELLKLLIQNPSTARRIVHHS